MLKNSEIKIILIIGDYLPRRRIVAKIAKGCDFSGSTACKILGLLESKGIVIGNKSGRIKEIGLTNHGINIYVLLKRIRELIK